ncbi:hypothetical protein Krad_2273 [Kineococcus radiotolerans SRS30216 = ATCC BAA-149]|uniref:Uncharacterized protein n=2 Tax=Kineococcus radiotolerans TaxID=131568 RepID=A6WAB5_KINRD|nr:hypothetical protein Krad_2273 [Kineococcus radiotolerans SRS30216 = ATCC BAA-149]
MAMHHPESSPPVDEQALCDLCGQPVSETAWLGIEVSRPTPATDGEEHSFTDYLGGIFCSQDHAAQWLQQPLPAPEPVQEVKESRRERLLLGSLLVVGMAILLLAAVGAFTLLTAI